MSLRTEQVEFVKDVIQLLHFIYDNGFECTFGEAFRTEEQQKIYYTSGRSKTMDSQHLKKLAIDLNIFKDGELCDAKAIDPIGDFWESLSPKNRWGGSWRGLVESGQSHFVDSPHFERQG